jgi:GT2 family glycosyltransferase
VRTTAAFGANGGRSSARRPLRPRTDPPGRALNPTGRSPAPSVVIVTLDGRRRLEPCLESISSVLGDAAGEVIVIDNGSRDPLGPWLRSTWPDVVLVELDENQGFSAACNLGARIAHGDIVIFLNDDTIVTPGWSSSLVAALEQGDVVIAGGLTVFQARPDVVNSAGTRLAVSGAGKDIGFNLPRGSVDLRARDVPGVSGVSMAVRREWFLGCGGFDEGFFMYFEDTDLCLRAWLEGYRVRFVPESVVLHAFGGTAGSPQTRWRYYCGTRNRLLTTFKAYDWPHLLLAWALSIAQDLAVVGVFLAQGRPRQALVGARGKLDGTLAALAMLPRYRRERRFVRDRRRRSISQLRQLGVIDPVAVSFREFAQLRKSPS